MNIIKKRYLASRSVGALIRGFSYFFMTIGGLATLFGITSIFASDVISAVALLATGIVSFIGGLFLLLSGELMRIIIDVEENTRRASFAAVMALPEEDWSSFGFSKDSKVSKNSNESEGKPRALKIDEGVIDYYNELDPNDSDNKDNLPVSLEEVRSLKRMLEKNPDDAESAIKLSYMYCKLYAFNKQQSQYDTAIKFFKTALEIDPDIVNSSEMAEKFRLIENDEIVKRLLINN